MSSKVQPDEFGARIRAKQVSVDGEQISIAAFFIMMFTANIFLQRDYDYCLHICETNFSQLNDITIFQGNMLRFKALAAEQLFHHKTIDLGDKSFENSKLLMTAVESAKKALSLF